MIFTRNHYIAQVVIPRFGLIERAAGLNFIESPVNRGSRRTSERTATTGPIGKRQEFCSVINLAMCGSAQVRAGEHLRPTQIAQVRLAAVLS